MSTDDLAPDYVSRAAAKLEAAIASFRLDVRGLVCADLGCSTGGFTDCLLRHGAAKVYAVDRGYGVLDYRLRLVPRVVVMERSDARTVHIPERVSLVTIDCGWTRQEQILPSAIRLLAAGGRIITLVKPQYEAPPERLRGGVLDDKDVAAVVDSLRVRLGGLGLTLVGECVSPVRGRGGNQEVLWALTPVNAPGKPNSPGRP